MFRAIAHSGRFRRLAVVPASVVAVMLAACAGDPAAPSGPANAATAVAPVIEARVSGRGRLVSSHRKYRDAGRRPRSGRGGDAALAAEALIDADGSLTLLATSSRASDPGTPAGDIVELLVKAVSPKGAVLYVRTFRGSGDSRMAVRLRALPAGASLEVTALVRIWRRVDAVKVSGVTPVLRPDLAVTGLTLPGSALVGGPTIIAATVTELNGQHGAWATCALSVGGSVVDRADRIWVDAGDAVSCAFTYAFAQAGTATVRVAVVNVEPRDADPRNNDASGTLTIATPVPPQQAPPNFTWSAGVSDGTVASLDTFYTRWSDPGTGRVIVEQATSSRSGGRQQSLQIGGTVGAELPLPVGRVDVAISSGGALVHAARWDDLGAPSDGAVSCATDAPGGGFTLYLGAYDAGFTTVTYLLSAGSVTYQSSEYTRQWNGVSYDETVYTDNSTTPWVPPLVLGGSLDFAVTLTSGATAYLLAGTVPLGAADQSDVTPLSCATGAVAIPPDTYDVLTCLASSYVFTGIAGSASGSGLASQSAARLMP